MTHASDTGPYHFSRELSVLPPVDVLVAGGGMAGFSAAVAAARQGARVMLVEQFADLGGMATTGGTAHFCGETTGQGEVFDDIIAELNRLGAVAEYKPYAEREGRPFDHEVLKFVLQELALAAGVDVLLRTQVVDADCDAGHIDAVILHNKSGLQAIRPAAVIDTTGEADVVHRAGFPTTKGREADGAQLPMSFHFFLRDVGHDVKRPLPSAAAPLRIYEREDDLPMLSIWPQDDGKVAFKLKVIGHDATDGRSLSDAEIAARRGMWSMVHFLQRHPLRGHEFSRHRYDYHSEQIGVREGRRIVGEYVLGIDDLRAGRTFEDGIAVGVFYLDAMDPMTDKRVSQVHEADRHVPPYHVPYRSLIPKGAGNVLAAGRCLSADTLAQSSARVMTTCAMMGQAAGIAAARCADQGTAVADVDAAALRCELTRRGAVLETHSQ